MSDAAPLWARIGAIALVPMLIVGVVGGVASYEQVQEGHIGIEREFGAVNDATYDPGPHFVAPWKDVQNVEIRPRTYNGTVDVTTLNGTTFDVEYVVRYRVQTDRAGEFVSEWQEIPQAERRLINPTVEDRMRREGAAIESSVIYTKDGRDRLTQAAREALEQEFSDEAMVLEAVQVPNFGIPDSYQDALNEKEIAKQEVQQEQYNVQKEEQLARQKRIQAQADAEVIRIKGEALRENPIVLQDRMIDAYDQGTVYVTDGETQVLLDPAAQASNQTDTPENRTQSQAGGR